MSAEREHHARAATWTIPGLSEAGYSQSLERGLAILASFTAQRPAMGIAEMSSELGMARPTTHRYARTLVALGYLEQDARRKYRLGVRVVDLGIAAMNSTGLREHARPFLEELRLQTSCSASLARLDGMDILYLERVRSLRRGEQRVELEAQPGSRLPAWSTALGKVLLAHTPEPERRRLLASVKLVRCTPNTITSKRALRHELDRVLVAGFAVDDEESAAGLCSIAVPVRDQGREVVAAVGLSAPSSSVALAGMVDAQMPHLIATADRISARLGYRHA
ncbi:MAG TPA: IclR family transcriptional regulator [Solirubrobacteraceae bacterium]|jgi:IclR family pca regulon transcriptional regulator|nr:IclR family transcriptional regulator [Solirubrobacteraceae bacterium]